MTIQSLILGFLGFLNSAVVPLIFAIALLFFVWKAFQLFIAQGGSDEGREKGKKLLLWGVAGFVLMVSIWGIVNLLVFDSGFGSNRAICPDYVQGC